MTTATTTGTCDVSMRPEGAGYRFDVHTPAAEAWIVEHCPMPIRWRNESITPTVPILWRKLRDAMEAGGLVIG